MQELAVRWYVLLSSLYSSVAGPLRELAGATGVPLVAALVFGLIGSTSPCQLTTNFSAAAFVARASGDRRSVMGRTLAYLLGKALVYTLLGLVVVVAGQKLIQSSIPAIAMVRKVLGPLMILLGLYLLGLVPLRFSLGQRAAGWVEARAGGGAGGAFLLGVAFSLAFCPTLFLLFFGLTIPLALTSSLGVLYPGAFALGTTLPLLVVSAVLSTGVGNARSLARSSGRYALWLKMGTGAIFLLAGINDSWLYWLV